MSERAPDKVTIIREAQPIPCHFSLWCKGGRARWTIARGPARPLWIHLCDRCARELLGGAPDALVAPAVKREVTREDVMAYVTDHATDVELLDELAAVLDPDEGEDAEHEPDPQARPPSDEPVLTCACGQEFRGRTAAANLKRHQRTCPAAQEAESA